MHIHIGVIGFYGHNYLALQDWDHLAESGIHLRLKGLATSGESKIPPAWLEMREQHGATVFNDWRALLEDPSVDLVVVDGPYHLHAAMLLEAVKAGKHVFCEKSLCLDWRSFYEIEQAVTQGNQFVWAMLNMRYQSGFYTVLRALQDNKIGDIKNIRVQKSYKHGERPTWYNDRSLYGGTALWVGNHAVDLMVAAAGPVHAVQAMHECDGRSYEMLVQLQCRHSSGALSSATIDFYQPEAAQSHSDDRLHVTGTEGVIEAASGRVRLLNGDGEQELPLITPACGVFADGIKALLTGKEPLVSTREMLMITGTCLAARDSADHHGEKQTLDVLAGAACD